MWIILKSWNKCNEFSSVSVFNVHAQCININHTFVYYLPATLNLKKVLWCIYRPLTIPAFWNTVWFGFVRFSLFFCFNHIFHFLTIECIGMFSVVQVQNNFASSSSRVVSLDLMMYNKRKCYQHKFVSTLSCVLHTSIPPILYQGKQLWFYLLRMR